MRYAVWLGVALALASSLFPSGARAAVNTVAAAPGSTQYGYATPRVVVVAGAGAVLVNRDISSHDVVAFGVYGRGDRSWCGEFPKGACPAFWSKLAPPGTSAPIIGVEDLKPGEYRFYCTHHSPETMAGTLVVLAP